MPKLTPYLECGKIINTHGCKGGMKVDPWMDSPEDFCDLERVFIGDGEQKTPRNIIRTSVMQGRFILLTLEGVNDMDAADAMRNTVLYAAREGREGQLLGTVAEINPGVAAPLYVVNTPKGQVMVPAVPAFIADVIPGECVKMTPIAGMFDDGADEVK